MCTFLDPKKILYLVLSLVLLGTMASCASKFNPRQESHTSKTLFSENFSPDHLSDKGFTYLRPYISINEESKKSLFLQLLNDATQKHFSRFTQSYIQPSQAKNRINNSNLTLKYQNMLESYDQTGILRRHRLKRIGKAIGVRYVAIPIIIEAREDVRNRYTFMGFNVARTFITTIRLQIQFWDTKTGTIRWQGYTDITMAKEDLRSDPISYKNVIFSGWSSTLSLIENKKPQKYQRNPENQKRRRPIKTEKDTFTENSNVEKITSSETASDTAQPKAFKVSEKSSNTGLGTTDYMTQEQFIQRVPWKIFYTIHVGSHRIKNQTVKVVRRLEDADYPAYLGVKQVNQENWYRARVGMYKTKKKAKRVGNRMVKRGVINDFWVSRVEKVN